MVSIRSVSLAAALLVAFVASAQTVATQAAHHPADAASSVPMSPGAGMGAMGESAAMAQMDAHMRSMQAMHEKMVNAKTPRERQALMGEHMKLMQQGMAMMGGMDACMETGMGGAMPGAAASAPMDPQMRQQMMDKRMDMMQSMMQMMMDRMQVPMPASK